MPQDALDWTRDNYLACASDQLQAVQVRGSHSELRLQHLIVALVWHGLQHRMGGKPILDHACAIHAVSSCVKCVVSDQPDVLRNSAAEWLRVLVQVMGMKCEFHDWKSWSQLRASASESNSCAVDLAMELLDAGFKPATLDSTEAREYLIARHGSREFIEEFFIPPPPIFWRGSVWPSWTVHVLPEIHEDW